jgi:signal transduction histidine kinase
MVSLRRRLTVTHTLVALLAVVLVALLASGLIWRAYSQLTLQQATRLRDNLRAALTQFYSARGSWEGADRLLERRQENLPALAGRRIVLADQSWRVLIDTAGLLDRRPVPPRLRPQAAALSHGGRLVGYLIVPAGLDDQTDEERGFVRAILLIVVAGSALAGALALLTALFAARRLIEPVGALTRAAQRLAGGERHEPLPLPQERELAELALAFNRMATELDRQAELRRQLVADIAHELRTPLSVLRLQVEALQDGVEQPTPEVIASLGEEALLLTRLVDDLRLLSLADAGQLPLAPADLEPRAVLERAAAAAAPRARQQGVALTVEPGGPLPHVYADPQRLAQVLGNLIENALRYTPQGGTVTLGLTMSDRRPTTADGGRRSDGQPLTTNDQRPVISEPQQLTNRVGQSTKAKGWGLRRRRAQGREEHQSGPAAPGAPGAQVTFSVSDSGPGIAPEDLPHIFDRFYRADRARSRETGGSGLGLAIVQRLVEAHGGQIRAESSPGQGTTFRVSLPVRVSGPNP